MQAVRRFENEIRPREDVGRSAPLSVVLREISSPNELPFELREQVEAVEALQVVEAIVVLQVLQLVSRRRR